MHKTNPSTGFPSVITIFSAPNYCDVYNNKGAILKFDNSTLNVLQYDCSPHPYHLPNFMDVFTWSMPFVIEKVTEMLYQILQPEGKVIDDDELPPLPLALNSICRESLSTEGNRAVELACQLSRRSTEGLVEEASAHDRIRQKVKAVGRIARIFKTLRQERETVIRLKGVCPGHRLAPGLLLAGKDRMRSELEVSSVCHARVCGLVLDVVGFIVYCPRTSPPSSTTVKGSCFSPPPLAPCRSPTHPQPSHASLPRSISPDSSTSHLLFLNVSLSQNPLDIQSCIDTHTHILTHAHTYSGEVRSSTQWRAAHDSTCSTQHVPSLGHLWS